MMNATTSPRPRTLAATAAMWAFAAVVAVVALSSCATVKFADRPVEWTARFDERTNRFDVRPIDGTRAAIVCQAIASRDGEITLSVERIRWFNNWRDGWTESDIDAEGTVTIASDSGSETGYRVLSVSPIELADCQKARIRYRDELLSTADATTLFNRRLGRICAAVACLSARDTDASTFRAFSADAGSFFFPEAYGYAEGTSKSAKARENRSFAEGYDWDTAYTRDHIPEELREIRDSGTLYRDWEESAELFYFIYTLEKLR